MNNGKIEKKIIAQQSPNFHIKDLPKKLPEICANNRKGFLLKKADQKERII